jgi:hypothetical protein
LAVGFVACDSAKTDKSGDNEKVEMAAADEENEDKGAYLVPEFKTSETFALIGKDAASIEAQYGKINVEIAEIGARPSFRLEEPKVLLFFASSNSVFYENPSPADYALGVTETCTGLDTSCGDLFGLKEKLKIADFAKAAGIEEYSYEEDPEIHGAKIMSFFMDQYSISIEPSEDGIVSPTDIAYIY